ncbi:MAG: fibronectin type III domain-containing protein [Deltaproteobacteria bacterium]|nr:fibronectin type III domain-containing protein [Deltaproteobacteria bacterium]
MIVRRFASAAFALSLLLAGCYNVDIPSGKLQCSDPDRTCPAGFTCGADNHCYQDGTAQPTKPGAPTNLAATPGIREADLTWSAPADDGGSAITGYVLAITQGSSATTSSLGTATNGRALGLSNGTAYTFTVAAVNAFGTGPASAPASATTFDVPGAPTGVAAVAGDASATVSWTAPASDGGKTISGYTITPSPGGASLAVSTTGAGTTADVPGLSNGTSYVFTVVATNAVGSSPNSSASNTVTPSSGPHAPGVPTGLTATPGIRQIDLTWTAPASDGGSSITGYTIAISAGTSTTSTTATGTSASLTGLLDGTTYTFTVAATNAIGTGPASNGVSAATFSVPGAPTGVTASPGDTQATVSWTAPQSDSPVTGYLVAASPGGATQTTTSTSATFTGLTNGTAYTFTVTATSAVGTGAASAPSSAVTPFSTPGAVGNLVATPGANQVGLTWTAPASNGGGAITGYRVVTSPGNLTADLGASATSTTVTGLANGTLYTFSVRAQNGAGFGASTSTSATTFDVPDAPTNVQATAHDSSADVSWTAGASHGSAITSYTVTASPGGASTSTASTSATVPGLTNGTAYTFTVVAHNALGSSATSTPSNSVTPNSGPTVPGAPTGVTVTAAGVGAVTVSWTAPGTSSGHPITGYTVTLTPGNATTTTTGTSASFSGLGNGTSVSASVTATNDIGTGSPGAGAGTTWSLPSAPASVSALAGIASADVTWTASTSTGGTAITDYVITASPGITPVTVHLPAPLDKNITGLTNGTAYTFSVAAINAVGIGPAQAAGSAVTPADVPTAPTGVAGTGQSNGAATVTWNAPSSDNGSAITGYKVYASEAGGPFSLLPGSQLDVDVPTRTATIGSLNQRSSYRFEIAATNAVGDSPTSTPSASVTIPGAPDAPTNLTATPLDSGARLTWTAPFDGGLTITGYVAFVFNGASTTTQSAVGTITTMDLTGLSNGTTYTVTLAATNPDGTGAHSGPVTVTPAPLASTAFTFQAPAFTPNGSTSTYVTQGATFGAALTSPTAGATYAWQVTGGTINGSGTTTTVSILAGAPGTLTATVTGTNGNGATSSTQSLTVVSPPATLTISGLPSNTMTVTGGATFSVPATLTRTYTWAITGDVSITSAGGTAGQLDTSTTSSPKNTISLAFNAATSTPVTITCAETNEANVTGSPSAARSITVVDQTHGTFTPVDGATNVSVLTQLVLTFDKPVPPANVVPDDGNFNGNTFLFDDNSFESVAFQAASVSGGNTVFTLTPTQNLKPARSYTAQTTALDANGVAVIASSPTFTTIGVPEQIAPTTQDLTLQGMTQHWGALVEAGLTVHYECGFVNFITPLTSGDVLDEATTSVTLANLSPGGSYECRYTTTRTSDGLQSDPLTVPFTLAFSGTAADFYAGQTLVGLGPDVDPAVDDGHRFYATWSSQDLYVGVASQGGTSTPLANEGDALWIAVDRNGSNGGNLSDPTYGERATTTAGANTIFWAAQMDKIVELKRTGGALVVNVRDATAVPPTWSSFTATTHDGAVTEIKIPGSLIPLPGGVASSETRLAFARINTATGDTVDFAPGNPAANDVLHFRGSMTADLKPGANLFDASKTATSLSGATSPLEEAPYLTTLHFGGATGFATTGTGLQLAADTAPFSTTLSNSTYHLFDDGTRGDEAAADGKVTGRFNFGWIRSDLRFVMVDNGVYEPAFTGTKTHDTLLTQVLQEIPSVAGNVITYNQVYAATHHAEITFICNVAAAPWQVVGTTNELNNFMPVDVGNSPPPVLFSFTPPTGGATLGQAIATGAWDAPDGDFVTTSALRFKAIFGDINSYTYEGQDQSMPDHVFDNDVIENAVVTWTAGSTAGEPF